MGRVEAETLVLTCVWCKATISADAPGLGQFIPLYRKAVKAGWGSDAWGHDACPEHREKRA